MSLSANYPALAPNLILDFANSNRVDPRITVTRASTATFYDGVTFAKAEENLALNSQGPAANWIPNNVTLTGNNAAAPDGTTTATLANDGAATATHIAYSTATALTASTTYTISAYLKDVTRTYAVLSIAGNSNNYGAVEFNLSTGAVSRTSNVTATINSSSITAVGSSWYRCVVTVTVGASVATPRSYVSMSDGVAAFDSFGRPSYAGGGLEILIWGIQLEQRSAATAYTVTTTQPITNYIQALQTAQNNVPRIDHSPTTTATLGLLVEESRTNSLLRSAEFDNAVAWGFSNASVTANATVSPDGTTTADKLIENTANSTHVVLQLCPGLSSSTAYTLTVYAKQGERSWLYLLENGGSSANVYFNLANGTVGTASASATASITAVGNGWYRCRMSFTTGVAQTTVNSQFRLATADTVNSYTGDGFSGIFLWGAQLEAGSFATSYIATGAATATRQADVISMTGTAFSGWYNALEGTLYSDANSAVSTTGTPRIMEVSDSGVNNLIRITQASARQFGGISGGTTQWDIDAGDPANNTYYRVAGGYKVNDIAASFAGGAVVTDTSATIPTVNSLSIGASGAGAAFINGYIRKLAYYPLRNTNAQLQALTGT